MYIRTNVLRKSSQQQQYNAQFPKVKEQEEECGLELKLLCKELYNDIPIVFVMLL